MEGIIRLADGGLEHFPRVARDSRLPKCHFRVRKKRLRNHFLPITALGTSFCTTIPIGSWLPTTSIAAAIGSGTATRFTSTTTTITRVVFALQRPPGPLRPRRILRRALTCHSSFLIERGQSNIALPFIFRESFRPGLHRSFSVISLVGWNPILS